MQYIEVKQIKTGEGRMFPTLRSAISCVKDRQAPYSEAASVGRQPQADDRGHAPGDHGQRDVWLPEQGQMMELAWDAHFKMAVPIILKTLFQKRILDKSAR